MSHSLPSLAFDLTDVTVTVHVPSCNQNLASHEGFNQPLRHGTAIENCQNISLIKLFEKDCGSVLELLALTQDSK